MQPVTEFVRKDKIPENIQIDNQEIEKVIDHAKPDDIMMIKMTHESPWKIVDAKVFNEQTAKEFLQEDI